MSNLNILIEQITNVGELADELKKLPPDTPINPFGSPNATLAYDKEKNVAYIDEDFSFLNEE